MTNWHHRLGSAQSAHGARPSVTPRCQLVGNVGMMTAKKASGGLVIGVLT